MRPRNYKEHFISAVVRRSGICRATVEQVLPAVFDEIRFQLVEGSFCVPIESFGTFAAVDIPERTYHYTYRGSNEERIVPPKRRLKFAPTKNMRRELEQGCFDPSRKAFVHHKDDPIIRNRRALAYHGSKKEVFVKGLRPTGK